MVLLSPLRWLSPLHWLLAPLRWIRRIVSLLVLASIGYLGVSAYQVIETARHLPSTVAAASRADAIVVLGAPLADKVPGPELQSRLEESLLLFQARRAPLVIVTGPASAGAADPSVAQASKAWLVANTVPKRAVLMVPAPDARRALDGVASLLGPGRKVLVVTDAVDALFIERLGAGLGLRVVVSPPLGSQQSLPSLVAGIGPLWRESSAMALGRIVGFGRIDWAGG